MPVDIFFLVDDGVELALAAHGHQTQFVRSAAERRQGMDMQPGTAAGRGEPGLMKCAAADLELLPGAVDVGQPLPAGNDLRNGLADVAGLPHRWPIDRSIPSQHGFGDLGDELHLAPRTRMPRRAAIA